jgi:propionyl-CoA carboxylase alpha chain/3-methylcrotonyl-CoA carboxylase alpha subunit
MLESVLIANRGEIARRVIRTARKLGVRTIAVYSDADADAPHVREADEAVHIGPAPARESYLVPEKILAAAKATNAAAIHPGYGFLSENAAFAQAVIDAGLVWVGPPPAAIDAMGLKDAAKKRMAEAGVPVTPGYLGDDQSPERLQKEADAIGYPVLIKAVAGGGGKGMRKVLEAGEFAAALASCQREAAASFGDDRVLIEKYVTRPRHIEVQVFGDSHGNVVHLFERDCSLQRRHQKVIEEAPAPGMDEATRAAVCDAAVKAAKAVNYEGAGTIEFIADASEGLRADRIWFMEMNTRLQVEHPVTEMITGQDLVEWQLRVASGEPLPLRQDDLKIDGWAMEARLYAENPATGFLPSTGDLDVFYLPEGDARIDSAVERGGSVSPFYDPMIAKLIVHRASREQSANALSETCRAVRVWPVKTNAAFLGRCAADLDFVAGDVDTGFIERRLDDLVRKDPAPALAVLAAGQSFVRTKRRLGRSGETEELLWENLMVGFRLNADPTFPLTLYEDGQRRTLAFTGLPHKEEGYTLDPDFDGSYDGCTARMSGTENHARLDGSYFNVICADDDTRIIIIDGEIYEFRWTLAAAGQSGASDGAILSPMPGKVVSVSVKAGDTVTKGQTLLVLEAMKMEHALVAPFDGVVAELSAVAGGQVSEGVMLAKLEAA